VLGTWNIPAPPETAHVEHIVRTYRLDAYRSDISFGHIVWMHPLSFGCIRLSFGHIVSMHPLSDPDSVSAFGVGGWGLGAEDCGLRSRVGVEGLGFRV
jgi:hypothetical protein